MPYLILKSCIADGARRSAGDIINLSDDEARGLTAMGRAEYVDAPKPKVEVEDRSVDLPASTTPKMRKRKASK
jgi:hypothetical protein